MVRSSLLRRTGRVALGVAGLATSVGVVSRVNRYNHRLKDDPAAVAARQPVGPDGIVHTDVLIIGTGGAALTAALRAQSLGLKPLVVEKSNKIGGTTCYSGSGCWIPRSHLSLDADDSLESALTYMEHIVNKDGDPGPASTKVRKQAFLANGPRMVKFLAQQGYHWRSTPYYPDYFQSAPGARQTGRCLEAGMFDVSLLGPAWRPILNVDPLLPWSIPVFSDELSSLMRIAVDWDGRWTAFKMVALRMLPGQFTGGEPGTLGRSLAGQLVYLSVQKGVPIWLKSPMKELTTDESGRVTGAVVEHDGQEVHVLARRGVVLATGGFSRNAEMRQQYQPGGITTKWSSTAPTDTGDGIKAAQKVGAATALMDAAWWGASILDPAADNKAIWCMTDRALPHSIIVDKSGNRFINEAQNYNQYGNDLWAHAQKAGPDSVLPAYLIHDHTYHNRYLRANRVAPRVPIPAADLDSGFVTMADTLPELAAKLGIDADGLAKTVTRFNGFVDAGRDDDFHRGESKYDNYLGDPAYEKNNNLGKLETGPYYAFKLWPGDLGTKGGVLTDEKSRALRDVGRGKYEAIPGLYVMGNASASVMGRTYAGAGSTLGPALTFAFIAVTDMAREAGVPESALEVV